MAIAHELVDFEMMLDAMVKQEQHDFAVMLTIRNRSVRSTSLTGTLVAEDWLERHGMPAEDRQTCGTCLAWSEGHVHQAEANRVLVSAAH